MGIAALICLLLSGYLYQSNTANYVRARSSPLGKMIEVAGHKIHVYARGQGTPTVVFTAGLGTPSPVIDFFQAVEGVAQFTRAVVYERPGYGWSEPARTTRAIEQVSQELYLLLRESGERPPYLLVGHSMGALEVLHYAQQYPQLVTAVVLVDGGSPIFYSTYKFSLAAKAAIRTLRFASQFGLIRLLDAVTGLVSKGRIKCLPPDTQERARAIFYRNWFNNDSLQELRLFRRNAEVVMSGGSIGNVPLFILSSEKTEQKIPGWGESQTGLLTWSSCSSRKTIPCSGHEVHIEAPNTLVNELLTITKKA